MGIVVNKEPFVFQFFFMLIIITMTFSTFEYRYLYNMRIHLLPTYFILYNTQMTMLYIFNTTSDYLCIYI